MFLLLTSLRNSNPGFLLCAAIINAALMTLIGPESAFTISGLQLVFLPILMTNFSNRETRTGEKLMLTLGSLPIPRAAIVKSRYLAAILCQFFTLVVLAAIVMVSPQKIVFSIQSFVCLANCALLGLGVMAAEWIWIDIFPRSKPFVASILSTALVLPTFVKGALIDAGRLENLIIIAAVALTIIVVEIGVYFRFSTFA